MACVVVFGMVKRKVPALRGLFACGQACTRREWAAVFAGVKGEKPPAGVRPAATRRRQRPRRALRRANAGAWETSIIMAVWHPRAKRGMEKRGMKKRGMEMRQLRLAQLDIDYQYLLHAPSRLVRLGQPEELQCLHAVLQLDAVVE